MTPYLAPDLLQSTLGIANGHGCNSASLRFRLARRCSSLSSRHYVSTPLGPTRTTKPAVPLAQFDDDSSFILTRSLGFQQIEKQFVDACTEPDSVPIIERKDFSCQIFPSSTDREIETSHPIVEDQSTQTEVSSSKTIACQINPNVNDCSIQTALHEQNDFSCQFMPNSIDQTTETIMSDRHTQMVQTDLLLTNDCSCQVIPEYIHRQIETIPISTQDIALQSSLNNVKDFICSKTISLIFVVLVYEIERSTNSN